MSKKFEKINTKVNEVNKTIKSLPKIISTSTIIKTIENINEAVGPYVPLVTIITILTKEIALAYESVQYNKRICGILVNRVEAAEVAIKGLMRQKEDNLEQFLNQDYYESFENFVTCLEKIKEFFYNISQLSKFEKVIKSGNIKEKFQDIINEFDICAHDLNLAISITTNEQMNKYLKFLQSDTTEMKKFLNNVEGGITNQTKLIMSNMNEIQKQLEKMDDQLQLLNYKSPKLNKEIKNIYSLNEQVNNQNLNLKVKRIDPLKLKESSQYIIRKGNRVTIQKKVYQSMDVACKPISEDIESIQKYLAILEKLKICPYIIQFYGLSEMYMIFEWAEHGNLREYYIKNKNIRWEEKTSIARDICRGLAFLHSVNILHHDLKCENILIAEKLQPKISNFNFSREFNAATHPINNINDMIHWLAPEKLKCISTERNLDDNEKQEVRYNIQCEIFSFGMLLWELGFQKKPYQDMTMLEIQKHVLKGCREILNIDSYSNPIQKEYCSIIKLAWEHEPSLRPGIHHLFNMLQRSYENHIPLLFYPTITSETSLISFDEGLQANKLGNYKKAWECFEQHANFGDMLGKYWQGIYYSKGYHVEKDRIKAKELFKEAANAGISDAQVRYALCFDKEKNYIDYLKYLKMSAKKNNATALYKLGRLYFYGCSERNVDMNKNKGIQYLKRAALYNHSKAEKILRENNIKFN
ncbi:hypothetical protein RclHR1_21450001 [Rhizophagus clarus]|uniref:Kinase-like domain-containing protein n=1 Tax=Rhizophagus clarus TaxID=94130 RepID=A0A2Z6QXJ6_9GLOM|nr:hypothetical protein RclHR1_21450001 [Rhizophagus clarus]GES77774.1 kinase-like domain-containing protein [Rhizophagus clarus]